MSANNLASLPFDIKANIASFLSLVDSYVLIQVYPEFEEVIITLNKNLKKKTIDVSLDFRILDIKDIKKIILLHKDLTKITTVNLNGIYWIDKNKIKKVLSGFTNLKLLFLIGTKFALSDIKDSNFLRQFFQLNIVIHQQQYYSSLNCNSKFFTYEICNNTISQVVMGTHFIGNARKYSYWLNVVTVRVLNSIKYKEDNNLMKLIRKKDKENMYLRNDVKSLNEYKSCTNYFHIKHLYFEYKNGMNPNLLLDVCRDCQMLKSLVISSGFPNLNLSHLKHAQNLESFSYTTTYNFQIDKFLHDIDSYGLKKLKRLYIKFGNCAKFSQKPLKTFLDNNKSLILFVIFCNIPETARKQIQSTLNLYVKTQQQIFYLLTTVTMKNQIPTIHWDMII